MINEETHLLFKLGEECGEVQQEASKCGIFGTEEVYPGKYIDNWERLRKEVHDVIGVYKMLAAYLDKDGAVDMNLVFAKIHKVKHYMKHAREIGTLEKL